MVANRPPLKSPVESLALFPIKNACLQKNFPKFAITALREKKDIPLSNKTASAAKNIV